MVRRRRTVPALWRARHHRHGLPRTVTFLTGTSGRDFFDRSNVGTHAHFTPARWVPQHCPKLPLSSPMLGICDSARSAYHPRPYPRCRAGTRREPHSGRRTDGASIVTRSPAAAVSGGFGLRPWPSGGQTEHDDRHRQRVHLGPANARHSGRDRRAPHSRPRVHVLAQRRIPLSADSISVRAGFQDDAPGAGK